MRQILRPAGVLTVFSLFTAAGLAAQETGEAAGHSTADGVYSEEQAGRGEQVMWNICAECHVDDDFGAAFLRSWEGATAAALLEDVKSTMPEDNPGGLRDGEYLDVLAYIFKLNGLPPGGDEMKVASLDKIKIVLQP